MQHSVYYKQNHEFETLLCQVRIVKSCEIEKERWKDLQTLGEYLVVWPKVNNSSNPTICVIYFRLKSSLYSNSNFDT